MKTLTALIAGTALVAFIAITPGANALALDYGDDYYVGQVVPGTPANPARERVYAQYLIDLFNGDETEVTDVNFDGIPTAQNFYVTEGNLEGPLPDFVNSSGHLVNGSGELDVSGTYDVTGALYIYAFYGDGAGETSKDGQLWYVGDLVGEVSIPTQALSHVMIGKVPDAGTTMILLGASLVGLGALRRRFSK